MKKTKKNKKTNKTKNKKLIKDVLNLADKKGDGDLIRAAIKSGKLIISY